MRDLETRRKALAAEAEVYRQTIKLEIQNVRLYTRQTKRKYTTLRPGNPLLIAAARGRDCSGSLPLVTSKKSPLIRFPGVPVRTMVPR